MAVDYCAMAVVVAGFYHTEPDIGGRGRMESVQLSVVRTGGKWTRFMIATEPRRVSSDPLYWDGTKWVAQRRRALLYADRQPAEGDVERLKAKM